MRGGDNNNTKDKGGPKLDKCGNCGKTDNLMKCTRCSSMVYCSKECQKNHWADHKFVCKIQSKINATAKNQDDVMGEILKGGFKQGDVVKIFSSHIGVFGSTDKEMPEGVPDNFLFVYEANNKYMMLGDEKRLYGEYEYKRLYDDLLANKEEWLEFFRYPANAQYCGDCFKVLEPLAKIFFFRREYEKCGQVLDMHAKLLHLYLQHATPFDDDNKPNLAWCIHMEHRANMLRFDLNAVLQRHEANIPLFRELSQYEKEYVPLKDHEFTLRRKRGPSDAKIIIVSKERMRDLGTTADRDSALVELHQCGSCGKNEAALGKFLNCARCKSVSYCGRDCQKNHWQNGHKKICKEKVSRSGGK